jgi:hypothetical protein
MGLGFIQLVTINNKHYMLLKMQSVHPAHKKNERY